MSNQTNIISAEQDSIFHKLNVDNIVIDSPKAGAKGVWVNIKYNYENGKKNKLGPLKIQTSELFSTGISRYEETSPNKMFLIMVNRKLRESEDISKEEAEDIKVEDATINILDGITKKVREGLKEPNMVKALNALGKARGRWNESVDNMEILKRKEQDSGVVSVSLSAKVVTQGFKETKFFILDPHADDGVKEVENQDEIIEKLSRPDVKCRATVILDIDSVFVTAKEPYLQVKLSEVVLSEIIENKPKRNIVISARLRNRSAGKMNQKTSDLYDSDDADDSDDIPDVKPVKKKVIKDDSDSD